MDTIEIDNSGVAGLQFSEKKINFSFAAIDILLAAIDILYTSVIWVVLGLILLPLFVILIVLANILFIRAEGRIKKSLQSIDKEVLNLDYEDATKARNLLRKLEKKAELIKDVDFKKINFLSLGLFNKLLRINNLLIVVREKIDQTLFIDCSDMPPLSMEEEAAYKRLNEIWGDDEDGKYARMTHRHLKRQLGA